MDAQTDANATEILSPIEQRLLGCLIEKEATTPEAYPLTVNALVLAANQKTNREPVMELEPGAVGHAIRQMEARGLVAVVDGARAVRYTHRTAQAYSVTARQQAVLAVLLLRGAQTAGELLLRTERLARFADLDELRHTLERLEQHAPPLVVNIGRGPGQREDRYMHLLGGPVDVESFATRAHAATATTDAGLEERVAQLETEVAALKEALEHLARQQAG